MWWRQLLAKMENGLPDTFKIWTATTRHEFPNGDRFKMHGKKELLLLRPVSIGIGPLYFFFGMCQGGNCGVGEFIQIYSGNYARLDMGKSRRTTKDGRKKKSCHWI